MSRELKASRKAPATFRSTSGLAAVITLPVEGADGDTKLGTFKGTAYTGKPMRPGGWYWDPIVIDLAGVEHKDSIPILRQHDHEQIVGHASVTVDADGIQVDGVFSGERQHVAKVVDPARNDFPWQMSVGADMVRREFLDPGEETEVNGQVVKGPLIISRQTKLGEASFVPLGADDDTSVSVAAQKGSGKMVVTPQQLLRGLKSLGNVHAAKYSDAEIDEMSEDEAKAQLKQCMKAEDEEDTEAEDEEDTEADDEEDEEGDDRSESRRRTGVNANRRNATGRRRRPDLRAEVQRTMKAARKQAADELDRQTNITAAVRKHLGDNDQVDLDGKPVNLIAHAIRLDWSAEKAELIALRFSRPQGRVGLPGGLGYGTTPPGVNSAVLEAAVFQSLGNMALLDEEFYRHGDGEDRDRRRVNAAFERKTLTELRARYTDQVQQTAHTLFKGRLGFQQLLTIAAAQNGYRGSENIRDDGTWSTVAHHLAARGRQMQIEADGASNVDIYDVLANVQNKYLLLGYLFTEQAYLDVCMVRPVKDFKPTSNLALWGDTEFQDIGPDGEIKHGALNDQAFANQATMRARMLTIPLTNIINDDLGALGQVPMILGRGWGLKVNKLFWTVFLNPGNDEGGSTSFYAATHTITIRGVTQQANSNLQSGATTTLTSAGLQAAEILFNNQVDPFGNPLGIDPEILLFPPDLRVNAVELMNAQFIIMAALGSTSAASKQANTNIWQGRFKPVMSRYMNKSAYTGNSTTGWYLLANPAIMPVIEIAAWNGNLIPTVQTASSDFQFNTLGISMRGFGGVGVTKQNFRGGVKSAGA